MSAEDALPDGITIDEVFALPRLARIDFYPDGTLRSVEFHAPEKPHGKAKVIPIVAPKLEPEVAPDTLPSEVEPAGTAA